MTDARIITREVLLEVVQAERHKAFEDGYELGQKAACLEKPEPASNFVPLKGMTLKPQFDFSLDEPTTFTFTSTPDTITRATNKGG